MFGDIGQLRTHFGTFEDITESYLVTETYDIRVVQRIQRVSKRCSSHLQASARRIRLTNNNNKTQLFANSVHDLTIVLACFHSKHLFVTYTHIEVSHSSYVESSEHHPISPCSTVELKLSFRTCACTSYTELNLHFPHLHTHTFWTCSNSPQFAVILCNMSDMDSDSNRTPSKAKIVKNAEKVFGDLGRYLFTDMVLLWLTKPSATAL
jgi:hypothetical protein